MRRRWDYFVRHLLLPPAPGPPSRAAFVLSAQQKKNEARAKL